MDDPVLAALGAHAGLRVARDELSDALKRITSLGEQLDQARDDASIAMNDAMAIIDRQVNALDEP